MFTFSLGDLMDEDKPKEGEQPEAKEEETKARAEEEEAKKPSSEDPNRRS